MDEKYITYSKNSLNHSAGIFAARQNFQLIPLSHLMAQSFPPVEWLVDGLIPEDAVVLLSGAPASFKTWFALELAKSVTTSKDFLGHFGAKPTNVLILDAESGERQLYDHFTKLNVNPESGIYYHCCNGLYLNEDFVTKLEAECWDKDIKLIIFDSLVRFHKGDENSAREMSKVFESFAYLKKRGITSLIICHTRKGNSNQIPQGARSDMDAIRGSSDILAACDVHLAVSRPGQGSKVVIRQTKNRFDDESKPFIAYFTKEDRENSKWSFGEILEDKKDIEKRNKGIVLGFIQANPGKNQDGILQGVSVYDDCLITNDKQLKSILSQLESNGQIYYQHGNGRSKLWYTTNSTEDVNAMEESQNV